MDVAGRSTTTSPMTRKKVKLQWIADDTARRATFRKRRQGLLKKVEELSILCNVKGCAVVYGPQEAQPESWPSAEGAAALLRDFRSMSEHEQGRRRTDQESFLRQRTKKLKEQIEREKKAAKATKMELILLDCIKGARRVQELNLEEATSLGCLVEKRLNEVQERMEFLRGQQPACPVARDDGSPLPAPPQYRAPSSHVPPLPPPPYAPIQGAEHREPPELRIPAVDDHATPARGRNRADQITAAPAVAQEERRTEYWPVENSGPYSSTLCREEGVAPPPLMDISSGSWDQMDTYFFPFN